MIKYLNLSTICYVKYNNNMKDATLQDTTYWLLTQAAIRSRHDFARMAEKSYGLTWAQMHTLCLLDPAISAPMNAISCQLLCDASNVTGIVDRLAAQGYIVREDSPTDRRIKVIKLTPQGAALREKIMRHIARLEPDGMRNLTDEERHTFNRLLAKTIQVTNT